MSARRDSSLRPKTIALLSIASLLIGATIVGSAALADPTKPFRADFDSAPDPIPAGATTTISVTISNDADTQKLGSSDILAPPGYAIPPQTISLPSPQTATVVETAKIELRDLEIQPLSSFTFQFTAVAPCTENAPWSLDAKQANNHEGAPGNAFLLDAEGSDLVTDVVGTCRLAFVTEEFGVRQPANSQFGSNDATQSQAITSVAYDPGATPVMVETLDGAGGRITTSGASIGLSLTGGTSGAVLRLNGSTDVTALADQGVATFSGLTIDAVGQGYVVTAASAGFDPVTSDPFNVSLFGQVCSGTTCSSPTAVNDSNTGSGAVSAANVSPGDELSVSFAGDDPCVGTGYVPISPDTFTVLALTPTGEPSETAVLSITLVIFKSTAAGRKLKDFQVCYAPDVPGKTFKDKSGVQVTQGLLPNCSRSTSMFCVVSRKLDGARNVTIVFTVLDGRGKT